MTRKEFIWLKCHQPFEVLIVEPYEKNKNQCGWQWCNRIDNVKFDGEYLEVKGYRYFYDKYVHYRIHRKYIRWISWYNGMKARFNTEGHDRGNH